MSSHTRSTARNVRQRKLNTKQGLRIVREHEIEETHDNEATQQIPQLETGVEKGEEVEVHLQAVINAAAQGAKAKQSFIPTPDAIRATGVDYDKLYPKVFTEPATYIRFSSTVEDCIGIPYCMNEDDARFLAQLNDGKDVNGQALEGKLPHCSEDTFEEVMSFFEDASQRVQPFANLDSAPILTLEEMEQAREEPASSSAEPFLKPIYQYWASKKGSRPLLPTIKVRVLDTTTDADDADPYVCFRRREVRQTRKTRGRDAQVVEKLKKLRWELEQARLLVESVKRREELNKQTVEISRKVYEQRRSLKEVKVSKNIIGEKGEDEELLVNQKPIAKANRSGGGQQRPTLRLSRSIGGGNIPENDLLSLADQQAEAEAHVNHTIESRKDQHRRWNHQWLDKTWDPITPATDASDKPPKWAPLLPDGGAAYPSPPPSLPSRNSQDRDGDMEMPDVQPQAQDTSTGVEYRFSFSVPPPGGYPLDTYYGDDSTFPKRCGNPYVRLRYGRGGRVHLEARREKVRGAISKGVVSDSESDDEVEDYYPISDTTFDYRCALNSRARTDGGRPSGDQTAIMAGAQAAAAAHGQHSATGTSS